LERAAAVRARAATMVGSDSRRTLLMLAEQWEALAAQIPRMEEGQAMRDARLLAAVCGTPLKKESPVE
jgi:hypothetical protein